MIKENKYNELEYKTVKRKIEINSREGTYTFNKHTYVEQIFGEIILKQEYNKIIDEASKIMGNALMKKKKLDHFRASNWTVAICVISFSLIVIYLFGLYAVQNNSSEALLYLCVLAVTAALLITLASSIYNFCRKSRSYCTLDLLILTDMDKYFLNINNTFFFSKHDLGYVYKGSLHFMYIPIKKKIQCTIEQVVFDDDREKYFYKEQSNSKTPYGYFKEAHLSRSNINANESLFLQKSVSHNESESDRQIGYSKYYDNKMSHYRVKSNYSHQSNNNKILTPKEVEIELNKTLKS